MQVLLRLVARLPLPLLHFIGAGLGWVVYLLSPRYRNMIGRNLQIAGLGSARLRAAVVRETGKGALEISFFSDDELERILGILGIAE